LNIRVPAKAAGQATTVSEMGAAASLAAHEKKQLSKTAISPTATKAVGI
jgi:hypothetical protein